MRYLSIYTPKNPMTGPPSQDDIARMMTLVEKYTKAGKLVYTGPLKKREEGLTVTREGDKFTVGDASNVAWMRAGGFAILEAASREEVIEQAKEFLSVGSDGTCEVLACPDMGPPPR